MTTMMIAVNLPRSYPQLISNALEGWLPEELSDELRRVTLGDWARVSLGDRAATTHVIGVYGGTIVSVYRVTDVALIHQDGGETRTRWSGEPADELGGWIGHPLPEGPWVQGQARPLRPTQLEPAPVDSAEKAMQSHLVSRRRYRLPEGAPEPTTSPSQHRHQQTSVVASRGWVRLPNTTWPAWRDLDDHVPGDDLAQGWYNIDTGAELVLFAESGHTDPANARFRLLHRAGPGAPHVELTDAVLSGARNHGRYEPDRVGHDTYRDVLESAELIINQLLDLEPRKASS